MLNSFNIKKRLRADESVITHTETENVDRNLYSLDSDFPEKKRRRIESANTPTVSLKGPSIAEKASSVPSKYDHVCILGVYDYDENGETQEDREYIQYGMTRLSEKYKKKDIPCSSHLYDFDRSRIPNLSYLSFSSKVILIGHGEENEYNEFAFGGKEADHLAEILFEDCELNSISTIEFICCNLANSGYIENLKNALTEEQTPTIIAYTRPLKMGFGGNLVVDLGEDEGIVSANQFKLKV